MRIEVVQHAALRVVEQLLLVDRIDVAVLDRGQGLRERVERLEARGVGARNGERDRGDGERGPGGDRGDMGCAATCAESSATRASAFG